VIYPYPTNSSHCDSEITFKPRSAALFALDPAPSPATTKSVLFDTELDTLAPRYSALALASPRVTVSSVPVKTIVLPEFSDIYYGFDI